MMPSTWQATPRAQDMQPLSVSMQLHPATDNDVGSIATACIEVSNADAHAQRPVPAGQAAQSHDQACCSDLESSTDRCNRLSQLQDREDGGHNGQMGLPKRPISLAERQLGLRQRPSGSSNGQSNGQLGATNRSEVGNRSRHKKPSDGQQHSGFRGLDATDHCSDHDTASLDGHSERLGGSVHGGMSAASMDGQSLFANMQQTGYGRAYAAVPPLKVRSAEANSPWVMLCLAAPVLWRASSCHTSCVANHVVLCCSIVLVDCWCMSQQHETLFANPDAIAAPCHTCWYFGMLKIPTMLLLSMVFDLEHFVSGANDNHALARCRLVHIPPPLGAPPGLP